MGKNKQQRYREVEEFPNVFLYTDYTEGSEKPRGKWHSDIFKNVNPIIAELACGKGDYTLQLSDKYPDKNYIGIDIKGDRIWKGAKKALKDGRDNVRFLRIYIDHLDEYFEFGEISEIWITFPDPYPKKGDISKRLTSPKFLNIYSRVLKPGGLIHLKTDSDLLFEFTMETIRNNKCEFVNASNDIYNEKSVDNDLMIKTYYEKKHLENRKTIKYVAFRLPEKIANH
ncbi:MAG TPA: tRNA (guanosine(46)-N7)-methyltransferase TrmB [Balneolaceae bacterium]|nr:tRNA (guanosine(46)-N7)-methyltransferase TrmB [Balneolaceae bacterium]